MESVLFVLVRKGRELKIIYRARHSNALDESERGVQVPKVESEASNFPSDSAFT